MKQYKTALNHVLNIDDTKKELISTIKKTVCQEVNKMCTKKDSVLRSSNLLNFTWKGAYKELQNNCPVIMELLKAVVGKHEKKCPRIVASMGILLFTRNQQLNSFQGINSIMMFRGHVRTNVRTCKIVIITTMI